MGEGRSSYESTPPENPCGVGTVQYLDYDGGYMNIHR